ncbi:MAG: TonB-dependent receptor [Pseudomonadota bacterium]|nr:TonB-dependent receptor [Pseudomonadota bacterium]
MSRFTCVSFARTSFVAIAACFALTGWSTAQAAAAAEEDEEELEELTEVQVTGTRIQNPNVTSANPITSITAEEMRQLGIVNVADALLTLVPQNISSYQPGLVGDIQSTGGGEFGNIGTGFGNGGQGNNDLDRGSFFIGNTIANLRGMDPSFGTRTLTLVDGRRTVSSSSQADFVDMNSIPTNLLQRMDVVTGGASATYGSGAVAGVVNLVLNNRKEGISIDLGYSANQEGDGKSPNFSINGGRSFFGGKGHGLLSFEWQKTDPIENCAEARSWCADSRAMLTNSTSSLIEDNFSSPVVALPGYENFPARFQMNNVRYNQWSPAGVIYENNTSVDPANPAPTSGIRFTPDGTGVEEFAYGFRGASNSSSVMNGDGPVTTSGYSLRAQNERKVAFGNFEYNFTERTTGYVQARYSVTDGYNRNRPSNSNVCARFQTPGVAAIAGGSASAGDTIYFGTGTIPTDQFVLPISPYNQPATPGIERNPLWNNANFRLFLSDGGTPVPNPISNGLTLRPSTQPNPYLGVAADAVVDNNTPTNPPPSFNWGTNVVPGSAQYVFTKSPNSQSRYWLLVSIQIAADFEDPGVPAVLPSIGRNSYAFLNQLTPEALNAVQSAFNRSPSTGGTNSATAALWGTNPCNGFTAIRKVWNPQIQQSSTSNSKTFSGTMGLKGRFGQDWRWETYYQYGTTDSLSRTYNGTTNLSLNFAIDAVIDDRLTVDGASNPTFGQPVCRITRDGIPQLDTNGVFISDTEGLEALAAGCKPLNIFGDFAGTPAVWEGLNMTPAELAQLQQEALAYAFKDSSSAGSTTLQNLSFTTNGTLWQGWGAGPLTGAFGIDLSQNTVDNKGTRGSFYLRSDLANWQDSFGGKTRTTEGYSEFNMPLVSAIEGVNLWSLNFGARYTDYYNKGGPGTTGASANQGTFNWKISTVYEPFDWVRLRLTRSRDMRAADYRELFNNSPTLPDQATGRNWWREQTEISTENQNERFGYVRVGNPDLSPEKSNTLTMGIVLSPGGWAQGMRMSADYSTISLSNGIYVPYQFSSAGSIIEACWRDSGNSDVPDTPGFGANLPPDMNLSTCKEISFAQDSLGNPQYTDILYVNASRPANGLTYRQRNVDVTLSYNFPLSRMMEALPGNMSLSIRGSRALEASGIEQTVDRRVTSSGELNCNGTLNRDGILICNEELRRVNLVGQLRSSQSVPGVSARPKWTGNFSVGYVVGDFTSSLAARYIGGARLDNTWCDADQFEGGRCDTYVDELGRFLGGSVDRNWVKPYYNFTLSTSYRLDVGNLKKFEIRGTINNLFDKDPPFSGGGTLSGASPNYHDTFGRSFRLGLSMDF